MLLRPLIFALARTQNLYHTQKDRHFVKIVKSFSGHTKMSKSFKKWKSKIFKIAILSSLKNIEEIKNE